MPLSNPVRKNRFNCRWHNVYIRAAASYLERNFNLQIQQSMHEALIDESSGATEHI